MNYTLNHKYCAATSPTCVIASHLYVNMCHTHHPHHKYVAADHKYPAAMMLIHKYSAVNPKITSKIGSRRLKYTKIGSRITKLEVNLGLTTPLFTKIDPRITKIGLED